MQAEDIWLMQSTNPGMCPRCNKPLTRRGTLQPPYAVVMCSSCGFSAPSVYKTGQQQVEMHALNPLAGTQAALVPLPQPSDGSSVWIDPAVSAFLGGNVVDAGLSVHRPGFSHPKRLSPSPLELGPRKPRPNPITPIPPSASAAPAAPSARPGNSVKVRPKYSRPNPQPMQENDVKGMPTVPPPSMWQYESPTFEVESSLPALSLVVDVPTHPEPAFSSKLKLASEDTDPSSWTAGGVGASAYARRIAGGEREGRKPKANTTFNPVDHFRWWLLHPGRLEFILWLAGTILLVSITFVLLLVTVLNFAQITPGLQIGHGPVLNGSNSNSNSSSRTNQSGTGKPTVVTTPSGLTLLLLDTGPLEPGQSIQLQGKGFSPQGTVTFIDEKNRPLLILNSQSNSLQADKHGAFIVTLNDPSWAAGQHLVVAYDDATSRVVELPVILAPGPFGNKGNTPSPGTPQPGLTATPTQNSGSGGIPTPVNFTPVPTRPGGNTPTPFPTPTQPPTPTPTMGVTPTPTPGTTPTVGGTPSSINTPTQGSIDPRLVADNVASVHAGTNLNAAWLWLLIIGYSISMLILGVAGILHKRRR